MTALLFSPHAFPINVLFIVEVNKRIRFIDNRHPDAIKNPHVRRNGKISNAEKNLLDIFVI